MPIQACNSYSVKKIRNRLISIPANFVDTSPFWRKNENNKDFFVYFSLFCVGAFDSNCSRGNPETNLHYWPLG